jgi:hypothetical protein
MAAILLNSTILACVLLLVAAEPAGQSTAARLTLPDFDHYTIRGGRVIFTAPAEQPADEIAELKEMQQRLVRALLAHNRDEYAAMLAPEWRVTYADGTVRTRSEVLDDVFGRPEPLLRGGRVEVADVVVMGDLAVVTGRTEAIPQRGDPVRLRFVDVVNRRNDRWMVTASFATFTP